MHYPLSRISLLELIRVLTFVFSIAVTYASAGVMSVRQFFKSHASSPFTSREITLRRAVYALAGFGLVCFAYGYFVEPYWIQITHVHVESPKLPKGTRSIRIVHISDLHSDPQ